MKTKDKTTELKMLSELRKAVNRERLYLNGRGNTYEILVKAAIQEWFDLQELDISINSVPLHSKYCVLWVFLPKQISEFSSYKEFDDFLWNNIYTKFFLIHKIGFDDDITENSHFVKTLKYSTKRLFNNMLKEYDILERLIEEDEKNIMKYSILLSPEQKKQYAEYLTAGDFNLL